MKSYVSDFLLFARVSTKTKFISLFILVCLADFLFYNHMVGWTSGAFGLLLMAAYFFHNSNLLKSNMSVAIFSLTIGQCFVLFEKSSFLSFMLMVFGLISLSLLRRDDWKEDAGKWAKLCFLSLVTFIRPFKKSVTVCLQNNQRVSARNIYKSFLRSWFLPIFLSLVFLYLFGRANPVVMKWLNELDLLALFSGLSLHRALFWLLMACLIFAIIRPRIRIVSRDKKAEKAKKEDARQIHTPDSMGFVEWAFTKEAVLRSLIIFNVMFAIQTIMDADFLFLGGKLPEGISYAQYAHKGAYPLVVTALLAAAFALATQSTKEEVSRSKPIIILMYIWIAQNVMLVFSSIYRTVLYVDIYALTYWRVAAFIWMGLVACGLVWIILRGVLGKSNRWLVNANVLTVLVVLYVTSFVNIGSMIACYNVMHSKEVSGKGINLDVHYLITHVGYPAIPALDKFYSEYVTGDVGSCGHPHKGVPSCKKKLGYLKSGLKRRVNDWRGWKYSEYRILQLYGLSKVEQGK